MGVISWCSEKQDYIALSTMEAEYVACCFGTQEEISLRSFILALNLTPWVDDLIKMLCDNVVAIQFTEDLKFHWKAKHIKRCHHFV